VYESGTEKYNSVQWNSTELTASSDQECDTGWFIHGFHWIASKFARYVIG